MNAYGRRLVLLVFLGLSLCVKAEPEDRLSIVLIPSDNLLHVKWTLGRPVQAIRFSSTPFHFVHDHWKPAAGAFDYQQIDLVFDAPVQEISAEIRVEPDLFYEGFYTPFLNYSQGVAFYQAHYLPAAIKSDGVWHDISDYQISLSIKPSQGISVAFPKPTNAFKPATSDRFRNYALLVKTESLDPTQRILMDAGLPDWLRNLYISELPRMLNFYQEYFGVDPKDEPLVLVGYHGKKDKPRSDGGVVGEQLVINVVGAGWKDVSPGLHLQAITLLAHETAHLWNADLAYQVWLNEGGATYLAQRALLSLGLISDAMYDQRKAEQTASCVERLGNRPIILLVERRDHYLCGEALFYWLEARKAERPWQLWKALTVSKNSDSTASDADLNVVRNHAQGEQAYLCLVFGEGCESLGVSPARVLAGLGQR